MRPATRKANKRPALRASMIAGNTHTVSRSSGSHRSESPVARLLVLARTGVLPEIPADGLFLEWYPSNRVVTAMSRGYRDAILRNRLPFLIADRPQGTGRAIYLVRKDS